MKLIIESGATKTDWCAIFSDGSVRRIKSEGINLTLTQGDAFDQLLRKAVAALNPSGESISEVHCYAAGLVQPRTSGNIEYASDLLGAARAVCGHKPGITAILGTGSNSCLYDGENIVRNVRSGGFILGDEGSAACLGKMFLSDYLKGLVPAEVAEPFGAAFKADYMTVVENVYKKDAPSRYLGSFSPWILEWYGKNDYVTALVQDNFRRFIERALSRYETDKYPVGIVGSFGYVCRDIFREVAEPYGISSSEIVEAPIEGLLKYHKD